MAPVPVWDGTYKLILAGDYVAVDSATVQINKRKLGFYVLNRNGDNYRITRSIEGEELDTVHVMAHVGPEDDRGIEDRNHERDELEGRADPVMHGPRDRRI